MLALTDQQLETITQAATLLAVAGRDQRDLNHFSNANIHEAIQMVLGTRGISTPAYLCDSVHRPRRRQIR
jgi:hypothetical protein